MALVIGTQIGYSVKIVSQFLLMPHGTLNGLSENTVHISTLSSVRIIGQHMSLLLLSLRYLVYNTITNILYTFYFIHF